MSGIKLPAIERPNGKVYRPRKIEAIGLGDEDEITSILVLGTHDIEWGKANTADELARLSVAFYYSEDDFRLEISGAGKKVWRRRELAGWDEGAPIYVYAEDPVNGRAGVMFPVEAMEAEIDTAEVIAGQTELAL